MSVTYSAFMLAQMGAGFTWAGKQVGMALLFNAPVVTSPGGNPTNPNAHTPYDLTGLLNSLGWTEVSTDANNGSPTYVRTTANFTSSTASGVTTVGYSADFAPIPNTTGAMPVYVAAAVFYVVGTVGTVTNPWLLVTDDAFDAVVNPGFVVTGATVSGAVQRTLFTYTVAAGVATVTPAPIVRTPGTLVWQAARETHIYLLPQRINYIANPSFEEVSNFGWRSDGTITRKAGGVDNAANHYVSTTGVVLECIPVPQAPTMRFSAYVRSAVVGATIRLALKALNLSYDVLAVRYATAPQPLSTTWTRYDGLFGSSVDDASLVVPRIECTQPFDCDLVLLEPTTALHPYWDGGAQTSFVGDFSWQGGAAGVARSYSFWYNNRYQTASRLFGPMVEVPPANPPNPNRARSGQVAGPGIVYDWIPQGSTLMTHWDVLSDTDTKHPLEDWPLPRTYNRAAGYDINTIRFTPAGTPTSVNFDYGAGTASINGVLVNSASGTVTVTMSGWTVNNFFAFGVNASGVMVAVSSNQTTYDAALSALLAASTTIAPAFVIQRINNANVAADYLIYDVRQV